MPRIQTFVSKESFEKLTQIGQIERKSLSKIAADLIELALKIQESDSSKSHMQALEAKQSEHILRVIGIASSILKCVHSPEKLNHKSSNAEEELRLIKESVKEFIRGYQRED